MASGDGLLFFQEPIVGVHEFFSFNFPLREYFFFVLRPPPPPHKFSNVPSLRKSLVQVYEIVGKSDIFGLQKGPKVQVDAFYGKKKPRYRFSL